MAVRRRRRSEKRKGSVLVLSAFLMVGMMAFLAFSIDLGYVFVARDQLQRSADAAALAAAWELIDPNTPLEPAAAWQRDAAVRTLAAQYASLNEVCKQGPQVSADDVRVGYLSNPLDPSCTLETSSANAPNAVQVRLRRTAEQNGQIPLFFARAIGVDRVSAQAEATAAFLTNVSGFRAPADGGNCELLPFALDWTTFQTLLANDKNDPDYRDEWSLDSDGNVVQVPDGWGEVNLFPQGTGSPGNRGTVDIGGANNSTADIARQILYGVSAEDLEHHGGELKLDENGELDLNGDTGISAGVKDELQAIAGQPRCIPIFQQVSGNGNNAQYLITDFTGIRIMEVQLTGKMKSKRVMVQVAPCCVKGAIPSSGDPTSHYLYTPVWLVR